jgi:hypothetical protein
MADPTSPELNPLFRWFPWRIGDPAVLLESILGQVEAGQRQQIMALYLDSVSASLDRREKVIAAACLDHRGTKFTSEVPS